MLNPDTAQGLRDASTPVCESADQGTGGWVSVRANHRGLPSETFLAPEAFAGTIIFGFLRGSEYPGNCRPTAARIAMPGAAIFRYPCLS